MTVHTDRIVTVTLRHEWDMGHRLPLHEGKCRRLHGHHYVAEVDVTGPLSTEGPTTGMVVDFYDMKYFLRQVVDEQWDHRTMLFAEDTLGLDSPDFLHGEESLGIFRVPFMPTAENIARELLRILQMNLPVTRVRVYETPNGWAEVRA